MIVTIVTYAYTNASQTPRRLWCDMTRNLASSGLEVELPLPRSVQRLHADIEQKGPGPTLQSYEFSDKNQTLRWRFKRITGGSDASLRVRLTLDRPYGAGLKADIGPANLKFTIPMFSASRIQLKYLQVRYNMPHMRSLHARQFAVVVRPFT